MPAPRCCGWSLGVQPERGRERIHGPWHRGTKTCHSLTAELTPRIPVPNGVGSPRARGAERRAADEAQLAAAAFLARYRARTLDAYGHDLRGYFNWIWMVVAAV